MIRILQLLPVEADFQSIRTSDLLRRQIGAGFEIESMTLGHRGTLRDVPRAVIELRRRHRRRFDIVHAVGGDAMLAATLANIAPVLFSPARFPGARTARWLRAASTCAVVHVVASTSTEAEALLRRGLPAERVHLIRPAVELARLERRRDPQLRSALGLADDDFVLLAAGESTRAANHPACIYTAGILNKFDPKYRVLMWGQGEDAPRVGRIIDQLQENVAVRVARRILGTDVSYESLFRAADAVLVTADKPVPTLPVAIAMASALPIVASVSRTVSELLEDRHTALMTSQPQARLLAQRVLDLATDPRLQWSICDMARTEAFEYFAPSRFLSQYRSLYEQLAARQSKITLPQLSAGAGLRFHGRA